jgi:Right handed beta helix region
MQKLLTLVCLIFSTHLWATNYYVSSSGSGGSDGNAGTSTGAPWLTISKVNTVGLLAGDSVSFNGGNTFTGNLLVNPATPPSSEGQRITVTSYGTGQATIQPGAGGAGVETLDTGYVTISNLIITGPGLVSSGTIPNRTSTTTSTAAGVLFMTTSSTVSRVGLTVTNCTISGCLSGVAMLSSILHPTISFTTTTISNNTIYNCGIYGVGIFGSSFFVAGGSVTGNFCYDTTVSGNNIHDIEGITEFQQGGSVTWTGFGIINFFANNTIILRNRVDGTGASSKNNVIGGPTAILSANITGTTISYNEVARSHAPNNVDGSGIDHDGDCVNVVSEYNWVHDCDGPGLQVYGFGTHTGNVFRYNIVQNCGLTAAPAGGQTASALAVWQGGTPKVYNNTFYASKSGSSATQLIAADQCAYANNIFAIENGASFGSLASTSTLVGNTYNVRTGSSFSINVNSTNYGSLVALHAAGLEKNAGTNYGAEGDPAFANAGTGGQILPSAQVETLSNYDISGASVAHNAGLSLTTWGVTAPSTDWHGNTALLGVDSGAVRYGSTYPSGSPVPGVGPGFFIRKF